MGKSILIVDDEVHIRLLLEQTLEDLEDEGVELLMAQDGEEALQIITSEHPDLVILDIMMPKIDGFEVCDTIKNKLGMEQVYVLMLTAKGQEIDRQKGEDVGADLYMTKPFDPDDLLEKVVEVLNI